MQLLKLKTSQPKNILNNKIIINKKDLKLITKEFKNNYLKFKIIK